MVILEDKPSVCGAIKLQGIIQRGASYVYTTQ